MCIRDSITLDQGVTTRFRTQIRRRISNNILIWKNLCFLRQHGARNSLCSHYRICPLYNIYQCQRIAVIWGQQENLWNAGTLVNIWHNSIGSSSWIHVWVFNFLDIIWWIRFWILKFIHFLTNHSHRCVLLAGCSFSLQKHLQ